MPSRSSASSKNTGSARSTAAQMAGWRSSQTTGPAPGRSSGPVLNLKQRQPRSQKSVSFRLGERGDGAQEAWRPPQAPHGALQASDQAPAARPAHHGGQHPESPAACELPRSPCGLRSRRRYLIGACSPRVGEARLSELLELDIEFRARLSRADTDGFVDDLEPSEPVQPP